MKIKTYIAFVRKETLHILRDARTLTILFGMPIALVLIFGYTVTNEFKNASISVYDQAKDEMSLQLIDHMVSSGHFELVNTSGSIQQLEQSFKDGVIKMGIVIPPQLMNNMNKGLPVSIQLIADATEPNYAATLTSYARQMIALFSQNYLKGNQNNLGIQVELRMLYNPKLIGAYYFIPGVVALILMLVCAMMTSLTIAREKEMGTMDLLLVSPLHPLTIVAGKVTPYVLLSFINALVVYAMGNVIFDVPVIGNLGLLLALTFLYLLVALVLGIFISTKAGSQQVAMIISLFALMLPTMLLSGFIFPIASMPDILQYLSVIVPAKYFIIIEKAIMLKGAGYEVIWFPAMVLGVMLMVLTIGVLKNFKIIYK